MTAPQKESAALLTRREAILRVSAVLGGAALVGQASLLTGCAAAPERPAALVELFTPHDVALLDEVADTILPETSTPGAKAAGVGPFMARMVAEAYDARTQRAFCDGLAQLERDCVHAAGVPFLDATPQARLAFLEEIDREQYERAERGGPPHYFRMIKELALLGYFTSEIGYTQAMRYTETPARFDPCVPYAPGDKAWAPHA